MGAKVKMKRWFNLAIVGLLLVGTMVMVITGYIQRSTDDRYIIDKKIYKDGPYSIVASVDDEFVTVSAWYKNETCLGSDRRSIEVYEWSTVNDDTVGSSGGDTTSIELRGVDSRWTFTGVDFALWNGGDGVSLVNLFEIKKVGEIDSVDICEMYNNALADIVSHRSEKAAEERRFSNIRGWLNRAAEICNE